MRLAELLGIVAFATLAFTLLCVGAYLPLWLNLSPELASPLSIVGAVAGFVVALFIGKRLTGSNRL